MSLIEEFDCLQYKGLREEIIASQNRSFQIITIGFTVLPAAQALGVKFNAGPFIVIVPFLIVAVAMIFLSENNASMRCGHFIRTRVETRMSTAGWETYLESQEGPIHQGFDKRSVNRHIIYAFYMLFILYYVFASFLAIKTINNAITKNTSFQNLVAYRDEITLFVAIGFTAFGALFGAFLKENMQYATTLRQEAQEARPQGGALGRSVS